MGNNHPLSKLYPDSIPFELICQYVKLDNEYYLNSKYLTMINEENIPLSARFHLSVYDECMLNMNLQINQSTIKLRPNLIQSKNPFKMRLYGPKTKVKFQIAENKLKGSFKISNCDKINFIIDNFDVINNNNQYNIYITKI